MLPWLPESEFAQLDGESRAWYDALPTSLQFTRDAMYIRKETSQLGALFLLHYMYVKLMGQTTCSEHLECHMYRANRSPVSRLV